MNDDRILDASGWPSIGFVATRQWQSVVKMNLPSLHEIHFMAMAVAELNVREIIISDEPVWANEPVPTEMIDAVSFRSVLFRNLPMSNITFHNENFLIYKELENHFLIVAGTEPFLKKCFPYPADILDAENEIAINELGLENSGHFQRLYRQYHRPHDRALQ